MRNAYQHLRLITLQVLDTQGYYGDGLLNPQLKPLSSQHIAQGSNSILPAASPDSSSPAFPIMSRERGARRERVFVGEDDDALYRDLLASQCRKRGAAVFCLVPLTPNHVHLILVPDRKEALGRALGERRRRYSSTINARLRVTGHLFQARFGSVAMDEERLMTAARYVALNSLAGAACQRAEDLALVERCRAFGQARR